MLITVRWWFATLALFGVFLYCAKTGLWVSGAIAASGGLGSALNLLVYYANGQKMPVFVHDADPSWVEDRFHTLGGKNSRFAFLADHFHIGGSIYSIGDLILTASLFGLVVYHVWRFFV